MSSRVEQARDRNLSRNLVAALGSSCFVPCGIRSTRRGCWESLQYRFGVYDLAFTVTPDKFHCSAVSTTVSSLLL